MHKNVTLVQLHYYTLLCWFALFHQVSVPVREGWDNDPDRNRYVRQLGVILQAFLQEYWDGDVEPC